MTVLPTKADVYPKDIDPPDNWWLDDDDDSVGFIKPHYPSKNGSSPNLISDGMNKFHHEGHFLANHLAHHVSGQSEMVKSAVIAAMTGLKVCFVGKSGIGKTFVAETLMKILGIQGRLFPLHPEITAMDITGMMRFDYELNQKVYEPGPFSDGSQLVILDELNRSSDKAQCALLDILNSNRVIVGDINYRLSDVFTIIMTMNPPEDPATRDIINALSDRIDYTLSVTTPNKQEIKKALAYHCNPLPAKDYYTPQHAKAVLREVRNVFWEVVARCPDEVIETASAFVSAFQTNEWEIPATIRSGKSMVEMATAFALLHGKSAQLPTSQHVKLVVPGCLGMLMPVDYMTTEERLKLLNQRVDEAWQTIMDKNPQFR